MFLLQKSASDNIISVNLLKKYLKLLGNFMNSYNKILLKLSGEAMAGDKGFGVDNDMVSKTCLAIKTAHDSGVKIGIVIGGGNYFRGRSSEHTLRYKADYIGMLATVMNSLSLQSGLSEIGAESCVMSSIRMEPVCEFLNTDRARMLLDSGKIVIFAGGTGAPFFSTDTAASLRALEIGADAVFAAKSIDGVYSADPKKDPNAQKYASVTYKQILAQHLDIMDMSAASMCMDGNIKTIVFSLNPPENLLRALNGDNIGTIIS